MNFSLGVKCAVTRLSTAADVRHRMFATVPAPAGSHVLWHLLGHMPRPAVAETCAGRHMPTCHLPACHGPMAFTAVAGPAGSAGDGSVLCLVAGCRLQGVRLCGPQEMFVV